MLHEIGAIEGTLENAPEPCVEPLQPPGRDPLETLRAQTEIDLHARRGTDDQQPAERGERFPLIQIAAHPEHRHADQVSAEQRGAAEDIVRDHQAERAPDREAAPHPELQAYDERRRSAQREDAAERVRGQHHLRAVGS